MIDFLLQVGTIHQIFQHNLSDQVVSRKSVKIVHGKLYVSVSKIVVIDAETIGKTK